ncbi:MAG TPA: hypothetical protein VIX89_08415 [Bryobacteraceae bacterium]
MVTRLEPRPPFVDDLRWEVVQRVAGSASFQRSPRLRELLLYICERSIQNRPGELREQQIGCGVFGRKSDYNPGEDNIVRVEIRQLRKRLQEYFASEGKDDPYEILIPKGAYVPVIELRGKPEPPPDSPPEAAVTPPKRSMQWLYVPLIVVLAVACAWMWWENHKMQQQVAAVAHAAPDRGPLWPLLFNKDQETYIVCADSAIVVAQAILHRSISLEEYLAHDYSGKSASFAQDLGSFAQSLTYSRRWQITDITDARLVQRLGRLNYDNWDKVSVRLARTTQIQDFKNGNSILLGSIRSNLWNSLFEPALNFRFDFDEHARTAFIRNRAPRAGEQPVYMAAAPGESGESYSIVALVPNLRHTGNVLIIAGTTAESTEAAGEFVMNKATSSALLGKLTKQNKDRIPYFEVLLKSGTLSGVAKNAEVVADRIIPGEIPRN